VWWSKYRSAFHRLLDNVGLLAGSQLVEMSDNGYPYQCDIEVTMSSPEMASSVEAILSVDREISDRVIKEIIAQDVVLHVHFKAKEARLLRVSVSSFYEYLLVCLKCYQEFDDVGASSATCEALAGDRSPAPVSNAETKAEFIAFNSSGSGTTS
jgi:Transcription factor Pcc1